MSQRDASQNLTKPALNAASASVSDTVNLANSGRAFYVGGAGNVKVLTAAGQTQLFVGVPAGAVLPIQVDRIFSADTTATDIVILW